MMSIPFGTIVLTDFPFTDLSAAKRRPALVVSTDNDRRSDVVVAFITSIPHPHLPDASPVAPTPENGLKVASRVWFDKLATLDIGILAGRLGSADPAWLIEHRTTFFAVFGFSSIGN
jgi:mRNA interferase MazF